MPAARPGSGSAGGTLGAGLDAAGRHRSGCRSTTAGSSAPRPTATSPGWRAGSRASPRRGRSAGGSWTPRDRATRSTTSARTTPGGARSSSARSSRPRRARQTQPSDDARAGAPPGPTTLKTAVERPGRRSRARPAIDPGAIPDLPIVGPAHLREGPARHGHHPGRRLVRRAQPHADPPRRRRARHARRRQGPGAADAGGVGAGRRGREGQP